MSDFVFHNRLLAGHGAGSQLDGNSVELHSTPRQAAQRRFDNNYINETE